jgi:pimeloyl-ACP methyl ester carboxylesterase
MPNAHVQIVPDAGHPVFLKAPDKYRKLLLGFLAGSVFPVA